MIINKDSKPKDTIYYVSACLVEELVTNEKYEIDILYEEMKKVYNPEIEYQTFLSALNFLFLIEKIDLNKEGLLVCI